MLPSLPIPKERAAVVYAFLQQCIASEQNRFVRAWAFAGLHRLATLHARYRQKVATQLERAMRAESASVRARLRHLPSFGE